MKKTSLILITIFLAACSDKQPNELFLQIIKAKKYSVIMFIAPDCPMCKTLSTPFSEMSVNYPSINFIAVYSGKHYEPMEINMFATETKLKTGIFRDYEYEVAHQLGASVTPEFFLIDSSANIIYQGAMDDRILELGNYKQQWDKHYLADALDAVLASKSPEVTETDAVGCVLEY